MRLVRTLASRLLPAGVALAALVMVVGGASGSASTTNTDSGTSRDPVPVEQADDDPAQLRSDLAHLADDWAIGGGLDGYPFWEKAYRRWRSGAMPGSMFKQYCVSYGQLLEGGRSRVDTRSLDTDGAEEIRDMLLEAYDLRIEALSVYESYLDAQLRDEIDVEEGVSLDVARSQAETGVQGSYRQTRLAMNRAQVLLGVVGGERIPEGSFM